MKRTSNTNGLIICWQILSFSILFTIVSLTILEITQIEYLEVSDKDIVFWWIDINN